MEPDQGQVESNGNVNSSQRPEPAPDPAEQFTVPEKTQGDAPRKHGAAITILVIIILLFIAGGVSAWYFVFRDTMTPEEMVQTAFVNFADVDSYTYDGVLDVEVTKEDKPFGLTVDFQGAGEEAGKEEKSGSGVFSTNVTVDVPPMPQMPQMPGGVSLNFGVETRITNNGTMYASITKMPPIIAAVTGLSSGTWIRFDNLDELLEKSKDAQAEELQTFFKENKAKIIAMVKKHNVLNVTEPYDEVVIDGHEARHFDVKVNGGNLVAFLKEFNDFVYKNTDIPKDEVFSNKEEMEKAWKMIERIASGLDIEVWVGTEKVLPKKIHASYDLEMKKEGVTGTIDFVVNFSKYGEPVKVMVPENSVSFEEFVKTLPFIKALQGGLGSGMESGSGFGSGLGASSDQMPTFP